MAVDQFFRAPSRRDKLGKMTDLTIHTLDARDNVLLALAQGFFTLDDQTLNHVIVDAASYTMQALSSRGIEYGDLRWALTPRPHKREVALIFDLERVGTWSYGGTIHQALLPMFGHVGSRSVLHGDLSGPQDTVASLLSLHLVPARDVLARRATAFYCVYVNNCSPAMVDELSCRLGGVPSYVGYADVTFASQFKAYLSTKVSVAYVISDRIIVQGHADDAPENANENELGYAFHESGFQSRSVSDSHFGLFLSYKIERPVLGTDRRDVTFSLAAISSRPRGIETCDIEIDERRLEYLERAKRGTLERLGVLGRPVDALRSLIRAKLESTYIYNLCFRSDYGVASFNMLLELDPADGTEPLRTVAGFKYKAQERMIELLTLF
jgi:hypothetical protein